MDKTHFFGVCQEGHSHAPFAAVFRRLSRGNFVLSGRTARGRRGARCAGRSGCRACDCHSRTLSLLCRERSAHPLGRGVGGGKMVRTAHPAGLRSARRGGRAARAGSHRRLSHRRTGCAGTVRRGDAVAGGSRASAGILQQHRPSLSHRRVRCRSVRVGAHRCAALRHPHRRRAADRSCHDRPGIAAGHAAHQPRTRTAALFHLSDPVGAAGRTRLPVHHRLYHALFHAAPGAGSRRHSGTCRRAVHPAFVVPWCAC